MTDLEQGKALYEGILDASEDDLPRLVFADWLEEHGTQPALLRAEFIRVQLRLDKRSQMLSDGTWRTWRQEFGSHVAGQWLRRENELLGRWCQDWVPPRYRTWISGVSHDNELSIAVHLGDGHGVRFRRGFIDTFVAPLDTLLGEDGQHVAGAFPDLRPRPLGHARAPVRLVARHPP